LALIRGEFKELWNYSEEHLVKPKENKDKEEKQQKQKGNKKND
jgi:hypothetical protein